MVSSYSRRELSKTTRLMENVPEVLRRDRVISGPSLLDDCGGQAYTVVLNDDDERKEKEKWKESELTDKEEYRTCAPFAPPRLGPVSGRSPFLLFNIQYDTTIMVEIRNAQSIRSMNLSLGLGLSVHITLT
ncbi:uncharacterized protein H6S33_008166 [Morchella sextelata]|uniref:uncharacterized protein n=1 Tax=Morchella sextelata TaxID=1174677 RepID=UPI001D05BBC8|nr:uncharacterized protein H6S33_008166 [Morchella sextelata]KAH0603162.1 hypothetical protein H6S33_008166 [Morchella sextelata]